MIVDGTDTLTVTGGTGALVGDCCVPVPVLQQVAACLCQPVNMLLLSRLNKPQLGRPGCCFHCSTRCCGSVLQSASVQSVHYHPYIRSGLQTAQTYLIVSTVPLQVVPIEALSCYVQVLVRCLTTCCPRVLLCSLALPGPSSWLVGPQVLQQH